MSCGSADQPQTAVNKRKTVGNSCLNRFKRVWQNSGDGARGLYMIQETQKGRETLLWRRTDENPSVLLVVPELQQLVPAQLSITGAAPLAKHQHKWDKREETQLSP